MLRRILALSVSAILCLSCLSGCKKDSSETEPDQEVVKTAAQHKVEAEKEINAENMDDELAKIEKAMEQDLKEVP